MTSGEYYSKLPKETQEEKLSIEFEIHHPMITYGAGQWRGPEEHDECVEAIKTAVRKSPYKKQFQRWLESGEKLSLYVEFHLSPKRAVKCDLDNLLQLIYNPLVEGACGDRAKGMPSPQTKDRLFWSVHAIKLVNKEEGAKIVVDLFYEYSLNE
jgi:hypothetical protein